MMERHPALKDIQVLERGWLSSNNILIADEEGAALIDSGYASHAEQTEALVRRALDGRRLTRLINTHLHADHCGGNARLQRAHGCEVWIPPGQWSDVLRWDTEALTYAPTGQCCERFVPDHTLVPGSSIELGGRPWSVIGAPGHDPHSVILFDPREGVLISADACGRTASASCSPNSKGSSAFADAATVFDLIESLGASGRDTRAWPPLRRCRPRADAGPAPVGRLRCRPGETCPSRRQGTRQVPLAGDAKEAGGSILAWAGSLGYLRLIHQRYFAEPVGNPGSPKLSMQCARPGL